MKKRLEALPGVGMLDVTASEPDHEGGRTYRVTFLTASGDVPSFGVVAGGLTGVGATVTVLEAVKGSEALGDTLSISFDSQM
eukprot:2377-Eustigmatos_ZCMA.PRE.1